ncbi:MAG: nucleotidyltransferase domain-containing protein [Actinobacteria bacterium]|nr:nucleotidyltransferase domain-containing protein [Actinomycetota bacterium]
MEKELAQQVLGFAEQAVDKLQPETIILYGSYATKTFIRKVSDVDIIILSERFAKKFLDRLADLSSLVPPGSRIEALGYTPEEFHKMLLQAHPTAIDAVEFGIALYGEEPFRKYQNLLKELYQKGLTRRKHTFTLPS